MGTSMDASMDASMDMLQSMMMWAAADAALELLLYDMGFRGRAACYFLKKIIGSSLERDLFSIFGHLRFRFFKKR